ncbi:hypothetical protein D3C84_685860 [compost metagenome]
MQSPDVIDDHGRFLVQRVLDRSCFTHTLAKGSVSRFHKGRGVVIDRKTIRVKAGCEPCLVVELQNRNVAAIFPFATDKGVTTSELEVTCGQCEAVGDANFFEYGR